MSEHHKSLIVAAVAFVYVTFVAWLFGIPFDRSPLTAMWALCAPLGAFSAYCFARAGFGSTK